MTKKTRVRVARIAAGAVIAAGASLTAAGAASALDLGVSAGVGGTGIKANVSLTGEGGPSDEDPGNPCDIVVDPSCETGGNENGGGSGENGGGNGENGGGSGENGGGNGDGGSGNNGGGNGDGGSGNNGGGSGGNDGSTGGTIPNGGGNNTVPQEQGSSALTETGSDSNPSAQGNGQELAETGAAETTFLLVGAATMIAGGIGFRFLPRLMEGRGGAAA
ncbi:hypothetical protein [Streptomyces sp. NPDC056291]|uniref:hypothetical protein n=1 Tax=Streptomyces sp. NPDC056291 TaxID=3345772 RepID=UPI0035E24818